MASLIFFPSTTLSLSSFAKHITATILFSYIEYFFFLKKNKNFISLQEKIENIDDKINYARTFYNDVVLDYNNLREQFPSNLVAKVFKFKEINYYK